MAVPHVGVEEQRRRRRIGWADLALCVQKRPLTLAIEISNPSAWEAPAGGEMLRPGVAVLGGSSAEGATVEGVEEVDPTRRNDDDLMPAIDRLTKRLGISARDLARIAVSGGPGGFTAVRMAVTVAKTVADACRIPCVVVGTADSVGGAAIGMGRATRSVEGAFAVALASKGETAWVAVFDEQGVRRGDGKLMDAGEVGGLGVGTLIGDRFMPEAMIREAGERGMKIVRPVFDPVACGMVSMGMEGVDARDAAPVYPREAEAVRKWREGKKQQSEKQQSGT